MGTAPNGYNTPKTNWQAANVVTPTDMNRIEGNIQAVEEGSRTIDPAQIPTSNIGTLRQFLDWFANRIKAITGKPNWYDAPSKTLEDLNSHINNTNNPHNVTAAQVGYTASDVLAKLKTVDGAGSGLDADTVDGLHASDLESVPKGATIYGKVGSWVPAEGGFEVISQFASPSTGPMGLAWDGTYLWNADGDADKIYKLNTSGTIISQFESPSTGPRGLAWDGTYLWNANEDVAADKIYKLNTSGTIISQFESPSTGPYGLTWDGTNLWNADVVEDKIYKLNTSGTILSQFASPSTAPTGLAWDGTNLWNADVVEDKIYKLNTSGTILSQFASPSTVPYGLTWDGTNLWLWNADGDADKIYKIAVYNYKLVA